MQQHCLVYLYAFTLIPFFQTAAQHIKDSAYERQRECVSSLLALRHG